MRGSEKKRLSATFVGHQGCGKSTILGHILRLLGIVDPVRAKKIDAAATQDSCRPARFAMVCSKPLFCPEVSALIVVLEIAS